MKLSVNEAYLVCALGTVLLIQQVWILKFAFGTERFAALSRNRPQQRLFFYFVTSKNDETNKTNINNNKH